LDDAIPKGSKDRQDPKLLNDDLERENEREGRKGELERKASERRKEGLKAGSTSRDEAWRKDVKDSPITPLTPLTTAFFTNPSPFNQLTKLNVTSIESTFRSNIE